MNFIERLQYYMQEKGLNDNQITVDAGLSVGLIGKAKKTGKAMNSANIEKILLAYPDLNPEWLLVGRGEMLRGTAKPLAMMPAGPKIISTASHSEEALASFTETIKKTPGAIPLVSEKAVGGLSNEHFSIQERDVLAYYVIPKFRYLGVDFMIEVIGDSMIPKFYPGDIIACSIITHSNFIQWNRPHLLATREQGLIVKRLRKSDDKNCLLAVSDNQDYDPFDIPVDEIVGMARIVGVIHLE